MTCKPALTWICLIALGALGACASPPRVQPAVVDGSNAAQVVTDPLDRAQLPSGASLRMDESLVMGTGENWIGRAVMKVPGDGSDAFTFFTDSYTRQGWRLLTALRGPRSLLVFMKPDRTATIEIVDGGWFGRSVATVTVVPGNATGGGGNR
jgi:hypothetical protein